MKPGNATVHIIRPNLSSREMDNECLNEGEKMRAERFRFPDDAEYWSACRAALKRILGRYLGMNPQDVPIVYTPLGKPFLATPFDSLHFNLSHCNDIALVAVTGEGPIGVDVEPLDRAPELLSCEGTFCHFFETTWLPEKLEERAAALLRVWTSKEATLKAAGTGLTHPPERIEIQFRSSGIFAVSDFNFERFDSISIKELKHPELMGYSAFLAAPMSVKSVSYSFNEQTFETGDRFK